MNRAARRTAELRKRSLLLHATSAALVVSALGLGPLRTAVAQPAAPAAADARSSTPTASRQRPQELNPQPLPPVDKPGLREKALSPQPLPPIDKPGARAKALNPQPLPPVDSTSAKALNPQPLPPIDSTSAKALNPQPLPPIDKPGARAKALNLQPLPPVDSRVVSNKPGS
jgi:hypothetical protein